MDRRQWVFMDAGDTFIYGYPTLYDAVMDCWQEENAEIQKDEIQAVVHRFLQANPRSNQHTQEAFERYMRRLYTCILDELAFPGNRRHYCDVLWGEWQSGRRLRLFDDVLPALQQLKSHEFSLGIITNWDTSFEKTLKRLGVDRLFDVVVVSCVENMGKPDPRIFQLAMERANTSFEQCRYLGDHPEYDIQPARQCGMKTIQVDYYRKYAQQKSGSVQSDGYVESLSAAVDRILQGCFTES